MIKKLLLLVVCFLTFTFANAQLNSVAIVGYVTLNGWPAPGSVDAHQMNTTDGLHLTLNNLSLVGGDIKLRGNNSASGAINHQLTEGLYIVNISSKSFNVTQKLIVK